MSVCAIILWIYVFKTDKLRLNNEYPGKIQRRLAFVAQTPGIADITSKLVTWRGIFRYFVHSEPIFGNFDIQIKILGFIFTLRQVHLKEILFFFCGV